MKCFVLFALSAKGKIANVVGELKKTLTFT